MSVFNNEREPLKPVERDFDEKSEDSTFSDKNEKLVSLPQAIVGKMIKQFGAGLIFFVISLGMSIWFKDWSCLIGVVAGIYFIFEGLWIRHDYFAGKIEEKALLCINVLRGKNRTKIVMRDSSDTPNYYEFIAPTSKRGEFLINAVYVVYVNVKAPRTLIAWQSLSYEDTTNNQPKQWFPKQ